VLVMLPTLPFDHLRPETLIGLLARGQSVKTEIQERSEGAPNVEP
jgi:hypothetical protein